MDYNSAFVQGLIIFTILGLIMALVITFISRKIVRAGKALRNAAVNRKARANLASMGIHPSPRSDKPSATPVETSSCSDLPKTIVISPFSEKIDFSGFDKPVQDVSDRFKAFLERRALRSQAIADMCQAVDSEAYANDDSVAVVAPAKEDTSSKAMSYIQTLSQQLDDAFDAAPEADQNIPGFLKKAQAI